MIYISICRILYWSEYTKTLNQYIKKGIWHITIFCFLQTLQESITLTVAYLHILILLYNGFTTIKCYWCIVIFICWNKRFWVVFDTLELNITLFNLHLDWLLAIIIFLAFFLFLKQTLVTISSINWTIYNKYILQ